MGCIRVRVDGAVGANGAVGSSGIGVAVTHGVEGHGQVTAAAGQGGIAAGRLGSVQQREDPLRGGHTIHRHVEIRSQLAQRQEEAGGEEHHDHRPRQVHAADEELPDRHADAGRGAAVGHGIHGGQRAQLDLQHLHRHDAERLGLLVHVGCGALIGVERLQRLQSLHIVQERGAHIRVFAPIPLECACGAHRHHTHHQHDQRGAYQQYHGRGDVHRHQHREQRHRRQHRVEQLRQEQFEETLDLVDALTRGLHHVGRAYTGGIRRPERQHLAVEAFAQRQLHAFGRIGTEGCGGSRRQVFDRADRQQRQQCQQQVVRRHDDVQPLGRPDGALQHADQQVRHHEREQHVSQQRQP